MDDTREKKISKIYRKLVSSNTIKAMFVFERLDPIMKKEVRKKLHSNGSDRALEVLQKINSTTKI